MTRLKVNEKAILQDINLEEDHIELEKQAIKLWKNIAMKHETYGVGFGNGWRNRPEYELAKTCINNSKNRTKIYKKIREEKYEELTSDEKNLKIMKLLNDDFYGLEDVIVDATRLFRSYQSKEKIWKMNYNRITEILSLGGNPNRNQSISFENSYIYPESYHNSAWALESILYAKRLEENNSKDVSKFEDNKDKKFIKNMLRNSIEIERKLRDKKKNHPLLNLLIQAQIFHPNCLFENTFKNEYEPEFGDKEEYNIQWSTYKIIHSNKYYPLKPDFFKEFCKNIKYATMLGIKTSYEIQIPIGKESYRKSIQYLKRKDLENNKK